MKKYLIVIISLACLFACEEQEKDLTPPDSDNLPVQIIDFDTIDIYPEDYNVPDMD
jgi:hypothetical protein